MERYDPRSLDTCPYLRSDIGDGDYLLSHQRGSGAVTDSRSQHPTEQVFLEENIATVAFHLGQPGAKLNVSHDKGALAVEPGEVLKEISRRLSVPVPANAPAISTGWEPVYDEIAKSHGWVLLKRGWYHPFAELYVGYVGFPVCYPTAKELCDKEGLSSIALPAAKAAGDVKAGGVLGFGEVQASGDVRSAVIEALSECRDFIADVRGHGILTGPRETAHADELIAAADAALSQSPATEAGGQHG